MCLAGTLAGRAHSVPLQHLTGSPAGQAHEVALVAALGEPGVGEGVAQLVGVDAVQPSLDRSTLKSLGDARVGQATLGPQPQPRLRGHRMLRPRPQVAIERLRRPRAEGSRSWPPALADNVDDAGIESPRRRA